MLDSKTKRRIDDARDILVGKIPDPKSQVEQITIALIYKFMDDMDVESEEFGGEAKFFVGEYKKYSWRRVFNKTRGGQEILLDYREALQKLSENPELPSIFHTIFRQAYLPYNDPETLKEFLKIIDKFSYDHSEELGDAFEYLLSVLGSQGDAGQFRTPRHIIDFMVEIVQPKKNETILDPACGTAGFLISAYKHILRSNSSNDKNRGDKLTPDERKALSSNINGYDISPDMVRLSLVNMYLHSITEPKITEYDTLTSEAKWNEYFDVIFANPPFMSPKGGIKPHSRFSVQSKRSEALFVDYIAEHLTAVGRGAVIVPEGVIFKSDTAFTKLRKMLIDDNYLYGVISLPAGVFNPYSGVKTSILLLDKPLARLTDKILFAKINNEGFDLGAQRRPNDRSELPDFLAEIIDFRTKTFRKQEFTPTRCTLVEKKKIAKSGEYNLNNDRYIDIKKGTNPLYNIVRLGDICEIQRGGSPRPINEFLTDDSNGINWIKIGDATPNSMYITSTKEKIIKDGLSKSRMVYPGDFILSNSMSFGHPYILGISGCIHDGWLLLRDSKGLFIKEYLYYILSSDIVHNQFVNKATGGVVNNLNIGLVKEVEIPLPSLDEQKSIFEEIESYQKIIDAARIIVGNYRPQICIDPTWPIVELGNVCKFVRGPFGGSLTKDIFVNDGYAVYEQQHAIYNQFENIRYFIDENKFQEMKRFEIFEGDVIMSCSGTMGKIALVPKGIKRGIINQALLKLTPMDNLCSKYLKIWMDSNNFQRLISDNSYGAAIQNVASVQTLKSILIPLPEIATQAKIVAEIEKEQKAVNSAKQLIEIFEQKISNRIARIWE
jgi:type I restriction enzyme M protein